MKDRVRVEIVDPRGRVFNRESPGEFHAPCFAEIVWSGDSKRVGVFVRDYLGVNLSVAYDVGAGRELSPGEMREAIASSIRRKYPELDRNEDPFDWKGRDMCEAFKKRASNATGK
jgi:hypothetical protein